MAKIIAYECPMSGKKMRRGDPRLVGYGMPPSSPFCHEDDSGAYVGVGRIPMRNVVCEESECDPIPRDHWRVVKYLQAGYKIPVAEASDAKSTTKTKTK